MSEAKKTRQISESLEIGILLALAGGFMDVYSYMCRGKVFANAQTGNILLLGINISKGNFGEALQYLSPIIAFVLGLFIANIVRHKLKEMSLVHWRQLTILLEITTLMAVSFMPQRLNLVANSLTSLVCAIQVESFRKINGSNAATTMCIGNLRTGVQELCDYIFTKNKNSKKTSITMLVLILSFAVGAIIGNIFITLFSERAIAFSNIFLITAFLIMFVNKTNKNHN